MSYTARPPFSGGMSNQNQQQQQGGQPNNANIGASGIPNMPMMNNAASIPGNHLSNPSGSSGLSVIDQKILQQQLLIQRQLLYQQQQTSQQNQQPKFQQQPNQNQALRLMSEMMNANDKNGSNVAQQTQQLQQMVQLQALQNIIQIQQAAQQQKSFQQQSVPLPTNTTITPVARQNMQTMQKPPVNYPRANVPNKNAPPNVGSSPMQSRKSFPNSPKSTLPQMQSGMVAAPLNIASSSTKSTLPQMPSAMTSVLAANSPKVYADILAASLQNSQASMNITPSLTITKTNSPSSSTSSVKNSGISTGGSLPNKPMSTNVSSQKSFLPEAISMSLGNVPLSVKATQPPSVTVTPTNKPTISPTNKAIPMTPQKINTPQNIPGLQKLSPTSPRTKQTPRKNTNPIRTTSLSPATQTSSQSVVPHIDTKVTTPTASISPLSTKPSGLSPIGISTTPIKPPSVNVMTATPPKIMTAAAATPVSQTSTKPIQSTPASNVSAIAPKPTVDTQKNRMAPLASGTIPKDINAEDNKNKDIKVEKSNNLENVKIEKMTVKCEKTVNSASNASIVSAPHKLDESKCKQNTSPIVNATNDKNQSVAGNKSSENEKKESNASLVKLTSDQVTKTPVTKVSRSLQSSVPAASPIDGRVKRNRFKTIPYQSPTPEFELVSKISANEAINAHKKKVDEDKLTLFYKNEFLAVRNAEGGFFLCQAINNVYKSSPKIRIRWLSEETTNKNIYCLDFYDWTDIECVLTSVSLNKMSKGKFELDQAESDRITSILKKALDVEKGIVERSDLTEDNPDGLDLSLYKNESQIEKKAHGKRKAPASGKKTSPAAKKQKIDTPKVRATPAAKAKSSAKTNMASVKKSTVVQATPANKRTATRRKLIDDTTEMTDREDDAKKGSETSKSSEPEAKILKIDGESPKQSSGKATDEIADQTVRPTRRSKV